MLLRVIKLYVTFIKLITQVHVLLSRKAYFGHSKCMSVLLNLTVASDMKWMLNKMMKIQCCIIILPGINYYINYTSWEMFKFVKNYQGADTDADVNIYIVGLR